MGNRFVPAIKEKYPEARIFGYSDTEGNPNQLKLLLDLFPSFYDDIYLIDARKSSKYPIKTQFGEENYPAAIGNMVEEVSKRIHDCDKFYDLHVDGLKWMYYDYPWQKYFFQFPVPDTLWHRSHLQNKERVVCHLYSRAGSPYLLEDWYVKRLVEDLSKSFEEVLLIGDPNNSDIRKYYTDSGVLENDNVKMEEPTLREMFDICEKASAFIGIDSGLRYIPHHFGTPTFVFSKYCQQYGQVAYSHLIRWLLFKNNVFPMHHPTTDVIRMLKGSIEKPITSLFPELSAYPDVSVERLIVERKI